MKHYIIYICDLWKSPQCPCRIGLFPKQYYLVSSRRSAISFVLFTKKQSDHREEKVTCLRSFSHQVTKCAVCLVAQSCLTLHNPRDCSPPGSFVHGDSPGKNTGVGCQAFLQVIFPTQGSNPGLPHCRWILYHLSHRAALVTEWDGIKTMAGT